MATPADNLEQQLSAYLDGELSDVDARELERTLRESASAREKLEGLRGVSKGLASLARKSAPMPLDAWARELPAVEIQASVSPIRRTVIRLFTRISAAAALILIGMFAAWMLPPRGDGVLPASHTAAPNDTSPVIETRMRAPVGELGYAGAGGRQPPGAEETDSITVDAATLSKAEAQHVATAVPGGVAQSLELGFPAINAPQSPVVNLVVVPQSDNQYRIAQAATTAWQADNADRAASALYLGAELRQLGQMEGGSPASLSLDVPPSSILSLVRSLDDQLGHSAQVRIQMDFPAGQLEEARRILRGGGDISNPEQPAAPPELQARNEPGEMPEVAERLADAQDDAILAQTGTTAAIGGGREVADASRVPGGVERNARDGDETRGRRQTESDASTEKNKKPAADARDPASTETAPQTAAGGFAQIGRGASSGDSASPMPIAAPVTAAASASPPKAAARDMKDELERASGSAAATQSSVATLADQVRETASVLGDRIDSVLRFALARLEEEGRRAVADRAAGQAPAGNVRLNVTILPPQPEAAPTSQPAAPR